MDLTDRDQVATAMEKTAADFDAPALALFDELITLYSREAEKLMKRLTLQAARTEIYNLRRGQQLLFLRTWPVLASPALVLSIDTDEDFPASTVVDTSDYHLSLTRGRIHFKTPRSVWGPGIVQVVYTGGMALTTTSFKSLFPSVATAVATQVGYHFRRRDTLAGNVSVSSGSRQYVAAIDWLPLSKKTIQSSGRVRVG